MNELVDVAFVGCQQTLSEGLSARFAIEPDIRVVATSPSGAKLREFLLRHRPQVVILESDSIATRGPALVREICQLPRHPEVVLLVSNGDAAWAVHAGALGCVAKSSSTDELLAAVRWAAQGTMWISPVLLAGVIESSKRTTAARDELMRGLTRREQEILMLLVEGLGTPALATRLCISLTTVKTHLYNIRRKLGVQTSTAAVALALNAGLRPRAAREAIA